VTFSCGWVGVHVGVRAGWTPNKLSDLLGRRLAHHAKPTIPANRAAAHPPIAGLWRIRSSQEVAGSSATATGKLGFKLGVSIGDSAVALVAADKDFKVSKFFLSAASCSVLF
jgi:hypothetical protein